MSEELSSTHSDETMISVLRKHVQDKGDQVLYHFLDVAPERKNTLTYRELYSAAEELAGHLLLRHKKGDRALMLYESTADFIIAFFACLLAGVVAVPAYPPRKNQKMDRLSKLVVDADASVIMTTTKIASISITHFQENSLFKGVQLLVSDDIAPLDVLPKFPEIFPDDLAFLQYSSGSTGDPKGVMITHANMVVNQTRISASFGDTPETVGSSWLPYFHDMGLSGGILQPLFVGFPVFLMSPTWFLQNPARWLRAIMENNIEIAGGPNFAWKLCIDKIRDEEIEGLDLSCWKVAFNGAEPISAETLKGFVKRFGPYGFNAKALMPCYGMAEATLFVSAYGRYDEAVYLEIDKASFTHNKAVPAKDGADSQELVSSGHTWFDDELKIVDPESRLELPEGDVGEIWFKSASNAIGYWKKPELTEATLNACLADSNEGGWLRTGDLGFVQRQQEKNNVFVTGRLKDMIIIRGRNYYPQDIETVVARSFPAFMEDSTAVFTLPVGGTEGIVVVQEVKRTELRKINTHEAIQAVLKEVAEKLELSLHNVVLIKPASIAKTSSGKIQRARNRMLYLDGAFKSIATLLEQSEALIPDVSASPKPSPINVNIDGEDLTRWICENIAAALGKPVNQIDVNANFLSLGLDSAISVSFMADLSERIGHELSPTLVYDYPSIRQLVNYITQGESQSEKLDAEDLDQDIAIIGYSCRLPGADDPEEFWENLVAGECHVGPYPQARAYGADVNSGYYNGGYLDDIERFDSEFFSITAKEARFIDPQHRIIMELSDEAMRNAGYHPSQLAGSQTGVFIGIGQNDYMLMGLNSEERHSPYFGTGCAMCMAANRVSYLYDFNGPSLAIDTACSSALVALHNAVGSLRSGDCNMALVGGVKLIMFSQSNTTLMHAQMLSPDGLCHSFDASANGYVRGEGAGVVMLKPLNRARKDGDNILAVIKGTASNQDGKSNGITAPNSQAQKRVIQDALIDASLSPLDVDFVEAHGTGTELGDPIEVNALSDTYGNGRQVEDPLIISSVKANIGHLEPAAGIAGLIKAIQCLRHNAVPEQIHFHQPNPHIRWSDIAVRVPTKLTELPKKSARPHFAGVSSFGFGGSNVHVVLQQGEVVATPTTTSELESKPAILALSCRNPGALVPLMHNYAAHIANYKHIPLEQLCWRLNQGQANENYRTSVVAQSHDELIEKLQAAKVADLDIKPGGLAFMFTGQGSQYPGMSQTLYQEQPVFKNTMDRCATLFGKYLEKPLLSVMYPADEDKDLINQTAYTQPALFAVEYSLAQLWLSFGVQPQMVLGHSIGEYAAACIAGVMTLEDAVKVVAARGRLIQSLPAGGEMLAVRAPKEVAESFIQAHLDEVGFAAVNGPEAVVLSGVGEAIDVIKGKLSEANITSTKLKVSHAFHSPLMESILDEFRQVVASVKLQVPTIEFISCLTGKSASEKLTQVDYWVDHVRQPVLFAQGVDSAIQANATRFLEVGPSPVLSKMARVQMKKTGAKGVASIDKGRPEMPQLLQGLGQLFQLGVNVDWQNILPQADAPRIPIPVHAYLKKRLFVNVDPNLSGPLGGLGAKTSSSESITEHLYQVQWQAKSLPKKSESAERDKPGKWLLLADKVPAGELSFAQQMRQQLEADGHQCIVIELSDHFASLGKGRYQVESYSVNDFVQVLSDLQDNWGEPEHLVHCASLHSAITDTTESQSFADGLSKGCLSSLAWLQAVVQAQLAGIVQALPRLVLLTENSQGVTCEHSLSGVLHNTLWGMARTISLEYPEFACLNIDLCASSEREKQAQQVINEVMNNLEANSNANSNIGSGPENQIVWDGSERRVARLEKIAEQSLAPRKPRFKANCQYLITGGSGALALKTARWLTERGARNIVLMVRRDPDRDVLKIIESLNKIGARVSFIKAEVADYEQVRQAIKSINASGTPLAGIFHTAGLVDDMALQNQSPESFANVMSPKVDGSWHLHQLTRDLPLDYFVMLSSAASLFGSPGQANYSAANAFLDGLAHYRKVQGLPALSLQLGMISEVGIAARKELVTHDAIAIKAPKTNAANQGMRAVSPGEYLEALEFLLGTDIVQAAVTPIDWQRWQAYAQSMPFLANFDSAAEASSGPPGLGASVDPELTSAVKAAAPDERKPMMVKYLQQLTASVSENQAEMVDVNVPLTTLGLDSLLVVELQKQINTDYGVALPVAQLFQTNSLDELASNLSNRLQEAEQSKQAGTEQETEEEIFEEGLL